MAKRSQSAFIAVPRVVSSAGELIRHFGGGTAVANGQGRSIAIWFPQKGTPTGAPSVELHFNLWRLGHGGQDTDKGYVPDLLDVGIMVTSPSDLASVSFYLPFPIENKDITDLGPKFTDASLATSIFNETLTATNGPSGSVIVLKTASGTTHCGVLDFSTSGSQISKSYLNVEQDFDGIPCSPQNPKILWRNNSKVI